MSRSFVFIAVSIAWVLTVPGAASATWDTPTDLSGSGPAMHPVVAVSGPAVHTAWTAWAGHGQSLYYAHSTDGGTTWSAPLMLARDVAAHRPAIAASGDHVYIGFTRRGDTNEVFVRRSMDGGNSWERHQRVSPADEIDSVWPALAAEGDQVHVAWYDDAPCSLAHMRAIYHRRSVDGGARWQPRKQVTSRRGVPSLAVLDGQAHMVYESGNYLWYHHSKGGRQWNPARERHLFRHEGNYWNVEVAASAGAVHIVWDSHATASNPGQKDLVFYRSRYFDGARWRWTRVKRLGVGATHVEVAAHDQNVHVVWYRQKDLAPDAWLAQAYHRSSNDAGTSWAKAAHAFRSRSSCMWASATYKQVGVAASSATTYVVWAGEVGSTCGRHVYGRRNM